MRLGRACAWLCLLGVLASISACDDDSNVQGNPALAAGSGAATAGAPIDFTRFDQALDSAIAAYNAAPEGANLPIRGASAIIVTKDRGLVHSKGYGQFAADRLYLIASSSKILSAGVLMRLADQGLLDVANPISDYLATGWGVHKTGVTAAQLLSNSSGLPSLGEISSAANNLTPAVLTQYGAHFCQYMSAGTLSACGQGIYSDDQPDNNRKPDEQFRYGGSQWQLAGALAEQVSGKSWAQLIRETYVEPCGAASLGFTNPYGMRDDGSSPLQYPPSFQGDKSKLPVTDNPSIEGGAYVTGPDYAKLLLLHLRDGQCQGTQVLSPGAVKTMLTDRVAAYGGKPSTGGAALFTGYGLGWWINGEQVADPGAFGAYPFLDLERDYGAMILLEASSAVGGRLAMAVKPALDAIIDAAR